MEAIYSFGYWVRRRRKALDMTQRELAEATGCALVTLKKIETDQRRPSREMAERLADALILPPVEREGFLAIARSERPADTLAQPATPIATLRPRDAVPVSPAPLIGREGEIATIMALMARPDVRLVTLAGAGGIGKTRLALAVAQTLQGRVPRPFAQGIVFVDLAAATSAEQMIQSIAVHLAFEPGIEGGEAISQLAGFLRPRDILLVLDNLEQVTDVATLGELLRETRLVRILATSRQRLGLHWEHVVAVAGLPYSHGNDDPTDYPSGRLFLACATRRRPDFALMDREREALARLCALVDGMPLALELAAAWVETLSVTEIATEVQRDLGLLQSDLADLPERHRSLRAVWDATWERLDAAEQEAFARLCVFRGGFNRTAAESIAGVTLGKLGRLTGRFLVSMSRSTGRYRIHELLRQYGWRMLDSTAAEETHRRHFDYFARSAEAQEARMHGPEQADVLRHFDVEVDNYDLALEWSLSRRAWGDFLHLLDGIHWYWRIRSRITLANSWTERAMALTGRSPEEEARLLLHAGHFVWMRGSFELARDRQLASLAIWRQLRRGDSLDAAIVAEHLAMALDGLGDATAAARARAEALTGFRAHGATWWTAFNLSKSAIDHLDAGDRPASIAAANEHVQLVAQLGDLWLFGLGRTHLAGIAWRDGDYARARHLTEEALAAQRGTGHSHSAGHLLLQLGEIARQEGDEAAARDLYSEALALFEAMGHVSLAAKARALLEATDGPCP